VALASLLIPVASAVLAACDDNGTLAVRPDSGAAPSDATAMDAVTGMDAGMDAAEEPEQEASCAVDAGPLDAATIAVGLQLVGLHKCENCHGTTLSGNNDGVPSLTAEGGLAYPPNLTPDPATGLGCWTNAQIENAILNGIDNEGMPLCNPMPQFGHLAGDAGLDQAQVEAIVEYLRSLPPDVNNVPNTPNCPVPPPVEAGAQDSGAADASSDAASGDSGPITDGSADGGG
jgi:cytochrome c553